MKLASAILGALAIGAQEEPPAPPAPPAAAEPEAVSLLGRKLFAPALPPDVHAARTAELDEARDAHEADPRDANALIWYGRRLAYLGRYRDSVAVFTRGAEEHPGDPRMLRHRGHRHITLRRLEDAERDLARAAELVADRPDEVEPDGQPNPSGVPIGTLKSNIHYHLGLVRYLRGDFPRAEDAYRDCLALADNPDRLCSTSYWLYLTLMRLGRMDDAKTVLEPIRADLDLAESQAYHQLLLLFRGDVAEDDIDIGGLSDVKQVTLAYGLACHRLARGWREEGLALLRALVDSDQWAAFGVIAGEADLKDTEARFKGLPAPGGS